MKKIFLLAALISTPLMYAQTIATVNSGAISNDNLLYAVGEIFVTPTDDNLSSSGIIGAVSKIELLSLNINEIHQTKNFKFYPNPTSNSVFLETKDIINTVSVYSLSGVLVQKIKVLNKTVDLSSLSSGVYLIQINNSKQFKLIKN